MSAKIFATGKKLIEIKNWNFLAVTAGIALLTAIAEGIKSDNKRKEIENAKAEKNASRERELIDKMREEEEIRRKEHQKKVII